MLFRSPGAALSDFNIFRILGRQWGCGDWLERWSAPAAAFRLLQELSRGQPCDFSGAGDYRAIESAGGIQWPLPEGATLTNSERRLFENGRFFTSSGRAKMIFAPPRPPLELTNAEYPLILLTGRGTSAQWHTNTRTGKSAILRQLYPAEACIELNPADANAARVKDHEQVRVVSRRAIVVASALLTDSVQPGQAFMPMHYAETNRLTFPSFDPESRQPSYKH